MATIPPIGKGPPSSLVQLRAAATLAALVTHDPQRKSPTLREKLIRIGAKVVRHGRYVTFQLAEVAIPRALFAEILRPINRLRPAPLPP